LPGIMLSDKVGLEGLPDISPIDLPFANEEHTCRLTLARNAMEGTGIEVLYVTCQSNQAWLTGYDGWLFYVHQGVILWLDGDPDWWGRNRDSNGALRTVRMDADHARGYADRFVQSTEQHPMQDLARVLVELELDAPHLTWDGRPFATGEATFFHV